MTIHGTDTESSITSGDYGLDSVYLETREYDEPKEAFKFITRLIRESYGGQPFSMLDVGCASGAFLHYALQEVTVSRALGVDIFSPLLELARKHVKGSDFQEVSLTDISSDIPNESFDVVTCLGTTVLFDDLDEVVDNLLSAVAPGGSCFVWDPMNENPVDLLMRYRLAENDDSWHPGFNIRSLRSWELAARRFNADIAFSVQDFRMPMPIKRGPDPMRSWTIQTELDPYQIVSGTGQILDFKVLQITLPK